MNILLNIIRLLSVLVLLAGIILLSGCARYARTVNILYDPTTTAGGGSGEVYVIIPESQQIRSSGIKWVFGAVKDDDNKKIDEVLSPRSAAEIIQSAIGLELKRTGYTVIPTAKRPADGQQIIDLVKTEIELEQISDLADIKAKCRVLAAMELYKNGQMIKRIQFESTSSKIDIKDRDLLANAVLLDALQTVMLKAAPEIHGLFRR